MLSFPYRPWQHRRAHLLDNCPNVREVIDITWDRCTLRADNSIYLLLRFALYVRMRNEHQHEASKEDRSSIGGALEERANRAAESNVRNNRSCQSGRVVPNENTIGAQLIILENSLEERAILPSLCNAAFAKIDKGVIQLALLLTNLATEDLPSGKPFREVRQDWP